MGEVINLSKNFVELDGQTVKAPRTKREYLGLCKRFLGPGQYREILCAIMDPDLYLDIPNRYTPEVAANLQKIVNMYHKEFKS